MRRLMIIALVGLMTASPIASSAPPTAPKAVSSATQTDVPEAPSDHRLFAVGAGAIIGIVVFNMLTYPLGSVPFVAAPLDPTPVDIALGSRVLATVVAGTGALIAHYLTYPDGEVQP